MGHKSHDPCFHKKYIKAGVMTSVAHYLSMAVFEFFLNQFLVENISQRDF